MESWGKTTKKISKQNTFLKHLSLIALHDSFQIPFKFISSSKPWFIGNSPLILNRVASFPDSRDGSTLFCRRLSTIKCSHQDLQMNMSAIDPYLLRWKWRQASGGCLSGRLQDPGAGQGQRSRAELVPAVGGMPEVRSVVVTGRPREHSVIYYK